MLENSGISLNGLTESLISSMPYISIAKPTRISPTSFFFVLFASIIMAMPINANIGENDDGLSKFIKKLSLFIPAILSSHAVKVVPIFEPIITPIV